MIFKVVLHIDLPHDAMYKQCVRRAYSPSDESPVCMSIRQKPSVTDTSAMDVSPCKTRSSVF